MNAFRFGFILLSLATHLMAVEWPQIRGGGMQGVVEAAGVPVEVDFEKDVVWKTEIPGKGWSSPVQSGGLIVVTTAVGEEKVELRVVAVDAESGKMVWNEKVFEPSEEEAAIRHHKNGLASPSALIVDGVVFAHFGHMGTAALSLKDGEVQWRYHETYDAVHGNGGSAVLADGVLVFTADGKDEALTRGLDAKTGKKLWEKHRGVETSRKFSFGTPLVIEMNGESLVVSQGSEHVGAYRPQDGELVWEVDCGGGWSLVPTPVLDEGVVYLATGFMKPRLMAIELKDAAGDVTKSHVKWEAKKDIPKTPSFVIQDDTIYLIEDSGKLSAINKKDGERLWVESLKRNFSASPMLVGNRFYSFTEEGVGYVHEVSREGAKQLAENDFGEPVFATPIIYEGGMIVRAETTLWKIKGGQ
ncbi:MAG: PQQ-binding-like beta-propeller repeat protein [Verrucomicrobiaceae bacterium]